MNKIKLYKKLFHNLEKQELKIKILNQKLKVIERLQEQGDVVIRKTH